MDNQEIEYKHKKYIVRKVSLVFLILAAGATLFSKTLLNSTLTQVKVMRPVSGNMKQSVTGQGTSSFKEEVTVYAPIDAVVKACYVEIGEQVEKGQVLYTLDLSTLESQLQSQALELRKEQQTLQSYEENIRRNQAKQADSKKRYEELLAEPQPQLSESSIESEALLKKKVEDDEALLQSGAISKSDYSEAELNWRKQQDTNEAELKVAEEEQKEELETCKSELETLEDEYIALTQNLEAQKIVVEEKHIQYQTTNTQIQSDGKVMASASGTVLLSSAQTALPKVGEKISAQTALLNIGVYASGFKLTVTLDDTASFVAAGDEAKLKIKALNEEFTGKISSIKPENTGYTVEIEYTLAAEVDSQQVDMTLTKEGEAYDAVVPYEAVYTEKNQHYVYLAEEVEDVLGKAYRVSKKNINVLDSDGSNVAVEGVSGIDLVITSSESIVQNHQRIQIENENEVLPNEE